ncbi:hypothetical protein ACFQAT_21080 [Undibacterium arcticum]|uniref:hypothetical protein n=1 Tax=Undibacterium arcticum TaxID=1762892 RepID=UPI00361523B3
MNRNDNNSASHTDDPGQPCVSNQHKDRFPAVLEKNITRRESAIIDDEAAVLSREKLATAREDAAHLRENAADLRDDAAYLREGNSPRAKTLPICAKGTPPRASRKFARQAQYRQRPTIT